MDAATFEIVADFLPGLSFILLIIFAAIWFRLRAGTSYGLLNRLYAIVIGGKDFHDKSVTQFWNDRKDIERFNTLFNTRAKSLKEVNLFIEWIERNNLDLRMLANLNSHFDMEKREVKEGKYRLVTVCFLALVFVLVVFSLYLIGLAVRDAALVKFNDETQWMWLSHDAAYSATLSPINNQGQDWRLTAEICSQAPLDTNSIAEQAKLKPENILNICESFINEKDIQRVDEIINEQKSFLWLALGFLLLGLYSYNSASRMNSAHQAKTYLKKKLEDKPAREHTGKQEDNGSEFSRKATDTVS
ncbi:DUF6216 family protein [Neptunomonas phycophila]|uniref:DUF6216 family protein n=1 Tax=Neptunomonas phycophila TaxID=1572645 RepID=UPI0015BEBC82|nr:DUF6216 family protein [Neptunomonas phycophila]QLE99367.1 hypothetical protein FLM49_18010 [Neptunomonas phycophila]